MRETLFNSIGVMLGLVTLAFVLMAVISRSRRALTQRIRARYPDVEVVALHLWANFAGQSGKGPRLRGNGALLLTPQALHFLLAVPDREITIPLEAVREVKLERSFLGRLSPGAPALVIVHDEAGSARETGFMLKNAARWKAEIEGARAALEPGA